MANRYETSVEARLAARVAELEAKVNRVCRWKRGEFAGDWTGECGQPATFMVVSKWHYCPRCGGKIEVTSGL